MSQASDPGWGELKREISARVAVFAPGWTDEREDDPGITFVELFEFLAESLLARTGQIPEVRARVREVLDRLDRAGDHGCADAQLTRNHYFTGTLLTAADLEAEQAHGRARHRRHNRLLHGIGIVHGLGVGLEPRAPGEDPAVIVAPGVAIAPDGEELVLCEPVTRDVCPGGPSCYVTLALVERPVDPTPDGGWSRIDELAEVAVAADVPPGHLAIARLVHDAGWRLDPRFEPPRV